MKTFRLARSTPKQKLGVSPSVAAVGFFDGVHKGHQEVINTAKTEAEEKGLACAVMTFDPHPSVILKSDVQKVKYITPLHEKEKILFHLGVDYLFVVTFDEYLAALSPQAFVDDFFVGLEIKHVVAGFDFSFGHKGKGSMDNLPSYARGRFSQTIVPKVENEEDKISSTRIRSLLDDGDVEKAKELLGNAFRIEGKVLQVHQEESTGIYSLTVETNAAYHVPKPGEYGITMGYGKANYHGRVRVFENKPDSYLRINIDKFDLTAEINDKNVTIFFHDRLEQEKGTI